MRYKKNFVTAAAEVYQDRSIYLIPRWNEFDKTMSLLEFYSCHKNTKINVNENIKYSVCYLKIIIHVREMYLQTYGIKFIFNTKIHWNYTRDEGGILTSIIQNYNIFFFSKDMRFIILRDVSVLPVRFHCGTDAVTQQS